MVAPTNDAADLATIEVTFTWDEASGGHDPITCCMSAADLATRDPSGVSLLSAKIRFTSSPKLSLSAAGPGEDEYMYAASGRARLSLPACH